MEKRESKVKDLAEKLQRGELTPKEALKELRKRGLVEHERWEVVPWAIYLILWLLPTVARQFKLDFLEWFTQLPVIHFPAIAIYISLVLVVLGIFLSLWATYMHYKKGGVKDDQTVILFKEGPYRVMRHPGAGFMLLPILLPIVLSPYVPFTFLSIVAIIIMIVYPYYGCHLEEKKLDIPKWGDEYIQYMKEVPRFNFIAGLWRLRKGR